MLSSPLTSTLYSSPTFFYLNVPTTTYIYTLSLHDALPILPPLDLRPDAPAAQGESSYSREKFMQDVDRIKEYIAAGDAFQVDRKSTRLNSSHVEISYAVFCLKKKKILLG